MTSVTPSLARRVLIVAPHFAPISAPDGQRARMLVRHLLEFGWSPHVLSVDPGVAEAPLEPELAGTLPPELPVTRVSACSTRKTRRFGLGNIAWRAWNSLRRAGDALLREGCFDLVYFSTTQFACLPLGRIWRARHGVPFVIDLQDPWQNDYQHAPDIRPPGGWKYRLAAAQARWLEPWTLRRCSGVVAVSPAYLDQLARRYPWWRPASGQTIPMGWSKHDFAAALEHSTQTIQHSLIRYLGRLGPDLEPALQVFLCGFALAWKSDTPARLRCEFRGGSYDPAAPTGPVCALANRMGVAEAVSEDPSRVPYLTALAGLSTAGANLILGSEDDTYAPSKTWLTLAARRPWLAIVRRRTVLHELLEPHAGLDGRLIDPSDANAIQAVAQFCQTFTESTACSADDQRLALIEAHELARAHADFFNRAVESR